MMCAARSAVSYWIGSEIMYMMKAYITPEDIIDRLSDADKKRFNQCVFTDVERGYIDGSVTLNCVLFWDEDPYVVKKHRQKYFGEGTLEVDENEH